jgi:hypothetical protein
MKKNSEEGREGEREGRRTYPMCLKAFSTNSRTAWHSPVARTKSSGVSCCSIIHIPRM